MRRVAVLGAAVAALVACGIGGAAAPASTTSLTLTYWAKGPRTAKPFTWTLRCNPPAGTLRSPRVACRRLASGGVRLFAPVPRDAVCTEIYGGPQVARVVGRVNGKRVWARFNRSNGCHIERWDRFAPWLLPSGV
jgi:Subtilisin inhibitor-like